ncbi:hypothetical protein BGW37DRAFT_493663 [Umbelopsis sp. PMI_123]|nr:hypothetical protein BGW37DRAFT_493663 [Umbelopsis sp. PMI_123]
MSFSLYGDLPKPKSSKGEDNKGEDGTNSVANGWAAVAPTPKPSSNEVATAAAASTSASSTEQPKPSGWALYNQFRPVMRKPTILAKPKIHKPVIPVGGKIVSTISAQTFQTATQEEKVATNDSSPVLKQNSVPLKTSLSDVNGFADLVSNAKKAKKIQKHKQKDQPAPIEFDMMEDYDPIRPNDYEMYMEQQNRLKEEEERERLQYRITRRSPSISSESSSSSRARSTTPPRYNKMFAPPKNLDGSENSSKLDAPGGSGPKSDTVVVSPVKKSINLEETAEDAWMRRARLSGKSNVTPRKRSTPSPEPDHSRSDNIDVSDHHDMKTNYDGSADENNKVRSDATTIVLLRNMVGPGEVDDTLQRETADECSKYGKVERCLIFEVPESQVGANQAVRIFVKFQSTLAAQCAVDDLNGRYFGGRIVTATFFDAARFEKLDLAPLKEEMINLQSL